MDWIQLLSIKRFGLEDYRSEKKQDRTEYQRDYDRLIFSSPFRRLQNKTQVFPLPGSIFVHNRLTHSLEVSSVGRSLGEIVGRGLRKKYSNSPAHFEEIASIVSAACLAHDLGNLHLDTQVNRPYRLFSEGEGRKLQTEVEDEGGRWSDFTCFEGNANTLRLLMHQFYGRRRGGFALTYSTLASIVKYPFSSELSEGKNKFGFFASEENEYRTIARGLGITCLNENPPNLHATPWFIWWKRPTTFAIKSWISKMHTNFIW